MFSNIPFGSSINGDCIGSVVVDDWLVLFEVLVEILLLMLLMSFVIDSSFNCDLNDKNVFVINAFVFVNPNSVANVSTKSLNVCLSEIARTFPHKKI